VNQGSDKKLNIASTSKAPFLFTQSTQPLMSAFFRRLLSHFVVCSQCIGKTKESQDYFFYISQVIMFFTDEKY